jgi:hypothetical protein
LFFTLKDCVDAVFCAKTKIIFDGTLDISPDRKPGQGGSFAPFSFADHQGGHLLRFAPSACSSDAASAAWIPMDVKHLDFQR